MATIPIPDGTNNSPTDGTYSGLKPFKAWVQMVLPQVYNDALSYQELVYKMLSYLNTVIDDVTTVESNVTALHEAYDALETYVNDTFTTCVGQINTILTENQAEWLEFSNTLDETVTARLNAQDLYLENYDYQTLVDNKLDEMASDGTLSTLIEPLLPSLVTAWLEENITQETGYVLDESLSVEGAAADAAVTGYYTRGWYEFEGNGIVDPSSGSISTNTSWVYTDYIPASDSILISGVLGVPSDDSYYNIVCFDRFLNCLGGCFVTDSTATQYHDEEIQLLDDTAFIRVTTTTALQYEFVLRTKKHDNYKWHKSDILCWCNGSYNVSIDTDNLTITLSSISATSYFVKEYGKGRRQFTLTRGTNLTASYTSLSNTYNLLVYDIVNSELVAWSGGSSPVQIIAEDLIPICALYGSAAYWWSTPHGNGYATICGYRYPIRLSDIEAITSEVESIASEVESIASEVDDIASEVDTALIGTTNLYSHTARIFKTVGCVGDSYTSGHINIDGVTSYARNVEFAWPHYMSLITGNTWNNFGRSGAQVSLTEDYTYRWMTSAGYTDAVDYGVCQAYMIGLGINDANRGISIGDTTSIDDSDYNYYMGGLRVIIDALREISPDSYIFVQTMPRTGSTYLSFNDAMVETVEYMTENLGYSRLYILDLHDYLDLYTNSTLAQDYIQGHYTAQGYEIFAEILEYILSEYINNNYAEFQDVFLQPYENTSTTNLLSVASYTGDDESVGDANEGYDYSSDE